MLCIDANVIIAALSGRYLPITERLKREIKAASVVVPSIVVFELRYGIANSARPADNHARLDGFLQSPIAILDFTAEDAAEAGSIRADLRRKGTPIGPYDVLIAAQARRRGTILITANVREFSRVPDLRVEDWTQE